MLSRRSLSSPNSGAFQNVSPLFFHFFSCDTSLIRNRYQHILQTSYKVPDMERLLLTAPTIVTWNSATSSSWSEAADVASLQHQSAGLLIALPRYALASFSVTGILERLYPFLLSAKASGGDSRAVYLLVKWDLIEFAPSAHQGSMHTHVCMRSTNAMDTLFDSIDLDEGRRAQRGTPDRIARISSNYRSQLHAHKTFVGGMFSVTKAS